MKKLKAVVVGYGARGDAYSKFALDNPEKIEIVAVADPIKNRQETAKELYKLKDEMIFDDWKDVIKQPKLADFAIIATKDDLHYEPTMAFIEKGYDILLEKPMAFTAKECKDITEAAEKKGVKIIVCHVLRFTQFWRKIKDIIDRGDLGEIISVNHMEHVGNVHQSHSFVRGNWRTTKEALPMILAKSCHDLDIIQWLLNKECLKVQSFGSLRYFTKENKPPKAPDYCLDGCPAEDECFYHAKKLYYDDKGNSWFRSVCTNTVKNASDSEVWDSIKKGPYGRCVFNCDNDVVDHQVVNMEFEGGCTVTFTMNAFNYGGRNIKIYGTKGELEGSMNDCTVKVFSFKDREVVEYKTDKLDQHITGGHGGGDWGMMEDLYMYFNNENPGKSICTLRRSYLNHIIGFAAEESRLTDKVINVKEFEEKI